MSAKREMGSALELLGVNITAPSRLAGKLTLITSSTCTLKSLTKIKHEQLPGEVPAAAPGLLVRKKQIGSDCVNPN